MALVSTHVLDLVIGAGAAGVAVALEEQDGATEWLVVARGQTGEDGRISALEPAKGQIGAGTYRLDFGVGPYYAAMGIASLHPRIQVIFELRDPHATYHLPLLVSPHAYTTYRGS